MGNLEYRRDFDYFAHYCPDVGELALVRGQRLAASTEPFVRTTRHTSLGP